MILLGILIRLKNKGSFMEAEVKLLDFKTLGDERGSLIALEENYNTPFSIKRVYYIFDTISDVRRGYHAHINLQQLAICVKGSCTFSIDNGQTKKDILLESPNQGLLLKGLIWREMHSFSPDCVLLVLANDHYNEDDYIRNYNDFLTMVNS